MLSITILLLPLDTFALTGWNNASEQSEAPDRAAPTLRVKNGDPAVTRAGLFDGDGTQESPYLIASASDWDALSAHINGGGTDYEGAYFKLTRDISVTTMLGYRTSANVDIPFTGTFDGDGHTVTVSIRYNGSMAAPFGDVCNAVIKNLNVTGTVKGGIHSSGLVGGGNKGAIVGNTLEIYNVTSSVAVTGYNDEAVSHLGGIVGHSLSARITMDNVVFAGSMNGSTAQGGLVGWGGGAGDHISICTFRNCLFAGTVRSGNTFHPVGYAYGNNGKATLTNFYTTKDKNNTSNQFDFQGTSYIVLSGLAAKVTDGSAIRYYDSIASAVNSANWTAGSTLTLLADVNTSSTITVPSGAHTLDLNGHGIRMTGSGSVVLVDNGAALTLTDSKPDVEHRFTVANAKSNGAGLATVNDALTSGYQTFTGGYITGGSATNGGGIKVNGTADLTMNGGTIIGNQSSFMGAGIKADNNGDNTNVNITVNGGAVIYNTVNGYGAGICSDGAVRVNGGTIAYNVASNHPGGIHCHYLHLNGGRIENNYAGATGFACGAHADHEVFISGDPVVYNNLINGTPVNLDWDRPEYKHGHKINLVGALTEGVKIGITIRVGDSGTFTSGWTTYMGDADPANYFTSDNSAYIIVENAAGESELVNANTVAVVISGTSAAYYSDISSAIGAWTEDSTLRLFTDVTTSSTVTATGGAKTLDLNGHELKRTGGSGNNDGIAVMVKDAGDLTILGPGRITGGFGWHGGGVHVAAGCSAVLDNCEISGNNGHYGGGLYLGGGTITLRNGTVVKGNSAIDGFGGPGIYAENYGTLIMENAIFTENEVRDGGKYAVFLCGNATLQVSGASVITGNTYNGEQRNLFLYQSSDQDSKVTISGELPDGAHIGVRQMNGAGTFSSGWKSVMGDAEPSRYFVSDNADYEVRLENGAAILAYPYLTGVSATGYEGDYDGQAHSITVTAPEGATVAYGTQAGDYSLSQNPTFTDAGTYTVYYQVSKTKFTPVTGSATVTIDPIDVTVTVVGTSVTTDYDSVSHAVSGYTATASSDLYDVTKDIVFSGTAAVSRTDAGTTNMGLSSSQFANQSKNFATVTFNVTDGYVTVVPINVTVTVTGHTAKADFNGEAHSVSGYDVSFSNDLYTEADFTFSGNDTAETTHVGTTYMGLSPNQFENLNPNFATVTFDVTDGYVTIDPIDTTVIITGHTETVDYDGEVHTVTGYDVTFCDPLYTEADFTFSGTADVSRTDAGTAYMGLSADQFENQNPDFATVLFDVVDGSVTVDPIDVTVTVTGHTGTFDYDGTEHSVSGYDIAADSDLYDVTRDVVFDDTAYTTRTDAGTTYMGLGASQFSNTNPNFATVTFEVTDGYVTINPIDVTVTVVGTHVTADYDGASHAIGGYTATASTDLYDVTQDFTFSGEASTYRTDAGTTYMGLAADQFENTNPNFATVAFEVTDGYVTIEPINVAVTVVGNSDTADYDGAPHTIGGYTATADTDLYDVTHDFTFAGAATASRTDVGTTQMGLAADQFENVNPNFATVTFDVTDGSQTVVSVDAVITAAPASAEPVYNGSAQALVLAGTVEGGTLLYALGDNPQTVPDDSRFGAAIPSATELGSYYVWYKVVSDSNHNDLAPIYVKVVLAEGDWVNLDGVIYASDGVTPISDAVVTLIHGNEEIDYVITGETGAYRFTVPDGIYDIVVAYGDTVETILVTVAGDEQQDLVMAGGKNESRLSVLTEDNSGFGVAVGGLNEEAASIRSADQLPADVSLSLLMTVESKTEDTATGADAIAALVANKSLVFFDIQLQKTVDSTTTVLDASTNVMEIAVPYEKIGKRGLAVYYSDGSEVRVLPESDGREAGTFRIDRENGYIFIYADRFATFAIGYTPYYRVDSSMKLGSFAGNVTVELTGLGDEGTFRLEDVSLDSIRFADIPKGQYTMTVTWTDGADNTLTMPFTVS